MNLPALEAQLAIDEGKRLKAYLDSVGILSVGIGHNCKASPVPGVTKPGDTISEETCADLFAEDIADTIAQLDDNLPWWTGMDDARQNVLANMCFNMGIGTLLTFKNTLAAMERGDYKAAAEGMAASKWAKQVGARAARLCLIMRGDK